MKFKKSLKLLVAGLIVSPLLWVAYTSVEPLLGTVKVISTLRTDVTADLADNTSLFLQPVIDTIDSLEARPATYGLLAGSISADALTFTDAPLASVAKAGQWVVPEVYETDAEMRRIDSIAGSVITVSRAFVRAHAVGDSVLLVDDGQRNIVYWGADPTSSDVSANVQAAIDDFDYRLDTSIEGTSATFTATGETVTATAHLLHNTSQVFLTTDGTLPSPLATNTMYFLRDRAADTFKLAKSPNGTAISGITGGSGTHTWHEARTLQGNNLFFPSGTWTIGASIVLPTRATSLSPGTTIQGSNAVIRTTSFTGPLFKGAAVRGITAGVGGGNSWYTFQDLAFRDETNLGGAGTSKVFDHTLFRMRLHRCAFSKWGWVIKSDDTADMTNDAIQSTRISECSFSNCDFIVNVSKAWDFHFCNNQTEFCNKVIHCVGAGVALVVGRICDNIFEGSGVGGQTILINGPQALTISRNYLEANGGTTTPEIDLSGSQQPFGVTLEANRFAPSVGQLANASWYPIDINPNASGVRVTGNMSNGSLIDLTGITTGSGDNWLVDTNSVFTDLPKAVGYKWEMHRGAQKITRIGFLQQTGVGPTNVDFGDGAPLWVNRFTVASYAVFARVLAVNDANHEQVNAYQITAAFVDDTPTAGFIRPTAPTKVVENETDTAWDVDLTVTVIDTDFTDTDVNTSTNVITSTAHGLVNGDQVYLTTTDTLPAPLVENELYMVRDVTTDTLKLERYSGAGAIDLTTVGSATTHTIRKDQINLVVTGDGPDRVDWHAEVTIILGVNSP